MGRRDIVEFLLASGARIDIFCAAMMGQLDAVRAFLTLQPKLIDSRGPHGFNLLPHLGRFVQFAYVPPRAGRLLRSQTGCESRRS